MSGWRNAHQAESVTVSPAVAGGTDVQAALEGVVDAIGSAGIFSTDESDAIAGAASPSASNVFATIADIPVADNVADLAEAGGSDPATLDDIKRVGDQLDAALDALKAAGQMTPDA